MELLFEKKRDSDSDIDAKSLSTLLVIKQLKVNVEEQDLSKSE